MEYMLSDSVTMSQAFMVTAVCMTVVFAALMSLSGVLELFPYIFKAKKENRKKPEKEVEKTVEENIVLEELEGDDAVAAIAAIVAASAEKRDSRIHIKSIRRIK